MSCNKPMFAVPDLQSRTKSGKYKYKVLGRYNGPDDLLDHPDGKQIPCGKCLGCRAQKSREWADRMILELDHSKKAVFLTLTYNDENLPVKYHLTSGQCVPTLQKRDLTNFFKRLRKRYPDKELRYYAVGEYGSHTQRPHYHVILYGLGLDDFKDLRLHGKNELGQFYYISDFFAQKIWQLGFCCISEVSWKTCAYVARYVKKKDFGLVQDAFVNRFEEPEYSVMSRNPGIGMYYLQDHPDAFDRSIYHFADQSGLVSVYLPPAFLRWLSEHDGKMYKQLKEERSLFMHDAELLQLQKTDLDSLELGELQEKKLDSTSEVIDFYRGL